MFMAGSWPTSGDPNSWSGAWQDLATHAEDLTAFAPYSREEKRGTGKIQIFCYCISI